MAKPPLDTSFIWGRYGLPDIVLTVEDDVFKANGEHPVSWSIFAKANSRASEAQTRIVVNGKQVADIEIHTREAGKLVREVQEVASAIVWSAIRAIHMGIDHDSASSSKAEKVILRLREWLGGSLGAGYHLPSKGVEDKLDELCREYHVEVDKIVKEEGGIIKTFRKWLEDTDLGTEDRGIILALEAYKRQAFTELDRLSRMYHVVETPREGKIKISVQDFRSWLTAYGASKPFAAEFVKAAYDHLDRLVKGERLAKRGIGMVIKPEVEEDE